jgi:antitoxin FitA
MDIGNGTNEGHCDTVEAAVAPQGQVKLGSLLAAIGREVMLTDEEFKVFENMWDRSPAQGTSFEAWR